MAAKVDWKPAEKGIYVRDYGAAKVYMLQAMVKGKRYTDMLGVMSLEDARIIRDTLSRNRKQGIPPFTYAEMTADTARPEAAEKLEQRKAEEKALKEEARKNAATVGRFWEQRYWTHRLSLKRSEKETKSIEGRWRNHVGPFFKDIPIEEVSKSHFADFLVMLRKKRPPLSEQTIHKCLTDMRRMWAYALEEEWVTRPFPGKSVVREQMGEVDSEKKCWLTPDEARMLLETVYARRLKSRTDHDVYCYVVLGLGLGLRAGDIDKLTQQVVESHIIERTKNKKARFVHFNFAPVRAMLDERLALYPPESPTSPLFVTQANGAKNNPRRGVPRKFYDIIAELGFNDTPSRIGNRLLKIDFHALRHTFATLAAMRGVDHLTLMRLMGHRTASMTLRYIAIADAYQAKHQEKAMAGIFPPALEAGKKKVLEE